MHLQAAQQMHWVCTAFNTNALHANDLASCAMNTQVMCHSSINLSPTWATEYAATEGAILSVRILRHNAFLVSEATRARLGSATRWCSVSRKKPGKRAPIRAASVCFTSTPSTVWQMHGTHRSAIHFRGQKQSAACVFREA